MPRPTRLEYEGAFYHVMNWGRGRQRIFTSDNYYQAFLETLEQAHHRFKLRIHAYCLMGNHYHLVVETPNANLSRAMRHINGVYTQRHNRLKKTDGPLFRGRFKSILVDADSYLLPLTRYIHCSPIDSRRPLVEDLADYPWSSYRAYTQPGKKLGWLDIQRTQGMLGKKRRYAGYKAYVEQGVDEDIQRFYNKGNIARVLGRKAFKEELAEHEVFTEAGEGKSRSFACLSADNLIGLVAKVYQATPESILKPGYATKQANQARKMAMYCCQYYGDYKLKEIAEVFGLSHPGSVSTALNDVRVLIRSGRLSSKIQRIDREVVIKRT